MADAHEATGKQMQKKAPKKLMGADCHLSLLVAVRIIPPPKRDPAILEGQQPVVGDGDPMRVARQVMQHMYWPAKGRLGVDDPIVTEQLAEKLREHPRVCQDLQRAMKLQFIAARQVLAAACQEWNTSVVQASSAGAIGSRRHGSANRVQSDGKADVHRPLPSHARRPARSKPALCPGDIKGRSVWSLWY